MAASTTATLQPGCNVPRCFYKVPSPSFVCLCNMHRICTSRICNRGLLPLGSRSRLGRACNINRRRSWKLAQRVLKAANSSTSITTMTSGERRSAPSTLPADVGAIWGRGARMWRSSTWLACPWAWRTFTPSEPGMSFNLSLVELGFLKMQRK